jgi:hypothetical protein
MPEVIPPFSLRVLFERVNITYRCYLSIKKTHIVFIGHKKQPIMPKGNIWKIYEKDLAKG